MIDNKLRFVNELFDLPNDFNVQHEEGVLW